MIWSSTTLRELVQSLAKATLLLKHSLKLRRRILCGDVTVDYDMLPHLHTIYKDVILLNVLTEV